MLNFSSPLLKLQVATAPAVARAATARGDIECLVFGKWHSVRHGLGSTVQREPIKVQINCLFYPVSIQQASVLSRRGEEVSERKCQESHRLL